jgi:succinate-semialdehyde dehydrogenase/glutarate-semialdehyde dehydrogenase
MMENPQLLIDGKWVDAQGGETFEVINPATSEVIAHVPQGGPQDVQKALEAADRAFKEWSILPPIKRASILRQAAQLARERREELGRLLTMEQGKPLKEAIGEINASADALEYFAEEARRMLGETIPTDSPRRRSIVIKQPVGVVVAIGPWNYPVLLLAWKLGPALIAGCTVVAKPPSATPLAATRFIALLQEAGVPPGVVNIVTGPGGKVGRALVENPLCRKVSITGQTETGKEIMRLAAGGLKRLSLELGGHCPLIVCEDADLNAAVKGGVYRSFRNMGQICNAINRIYVHDSIFQLFVDQFVKETAVLTIGNGLENPVVDLGPMTTESGRQKVREHIQDAVSKGAKILYGGKEPSGQEFERGFFFEPTVLVDVNHEMKVMREETFGPVAPIMAVTSLDEAIEYANDSPYGLVAYVYTKDLVKAITTAERLEYGTVGINNVAGGEVAFPYGGWKESGMGVENSSRAVEEYQQLKHIRIDIGQG